MQEYLWVFSFVNLNDVISFLRIPRFHANTEAQMAMRPKPLDQDQRTDLMQEPIDGSRGLGLAGTGLCVTVGVMTKTYPLYVWAGGPIVDIKLPKETS